MKSEIKNNKGRPQTLEGGFVSRLFSLDRPTDSKLRELSQKTGFSYSEIVRQSIKQYWNNSI